MLCIYGINNRMFRVSTNREKVGSWTWLKGISRTPSPFLHLIRKKVIRQQASSALMSLFPLMFVHEPFLVPHTEASFPFLRKTRHFPNISFRYCLQQTVKEWMHTQQWHSAAFLSFLYALHNMEITVTEPAVYTSSRDGKRRHYLSVYQDQNLYVNACTESCHFVDVYRKFRCAYMQRCMLSW